MRENRLSGSEGGGAESNRLFLPLSSTKMLILETPAQADAPPKNGTFLTIL